LDKVKLLIQGYAIHKPNGKWDATSAAVLVQSAGKFVLIDPGVNPSILKTVLKNELLSLDDIDIIVVTHSHYDHSRNIKLFNKAKILDLSYLYGQREQPANPELIPNTDIEILITPGHVDKHVAFLVRTDLGKYVIAGDVFWWEDEEEQKVDFNSLIEHKDPVAKNSVLLQKSRLYLISIANYIIPGHGKEFMVSN
jgi:glyoxylase-like metal-dependent hydrolase (beta-lactamase superfamily II)